MQIREIMRSCPVMPVLVIEKTEHAVPLAKALVAGGIRVLEVTLRTEAALEAVRLIAEQVPEPSSASARLFVPSNSSSPSRLAHVSPSPPA